MKPTIALACILKNEINNIPRMLESVRGCFDEIHLTDTGSDDGSLELLQKYVKTGENPAKTPLFLHHFKWINDFSAARNYAFSKPETDYIMWLDLDDVLQNREAFISWRDHALVLGEFWLATYNYALTAEGKPLCSFARERIVKRNLCFTWNYPVHEGILPKSPKKKDVVVQYAATWSVNHLRSEADLLQDRSRNLQIMKPLKDTSPRLRYYYGKELFENNKIYEGFGELLAAIAMPELEPHDRIMGLQYACFAAMKLNEFEKAIQLAHQGVQLAPLRSEFFIIIADCYLRLNKPLEAIPMYKAATRGVRAGGGLFQGPIFSTEEAYTHYPLNQLARIYTNLGDLKTAKSYVDEAFEKYGPLPETVGIRNDIEVISSKLAMDTHPRIETQDIVISCPPGGLYEWDGNVYREKGIGGSETAAIEMAEWLLRLTGSKVIIFNKRDKPTEINGVEYRSTMYAPEYFRDHKPLVHIAWRHATKLSSDPFYVWCHDLAAPGVESKESNHKVLALSQFHASYLEHMFGVAKDRILVTSNGIRPERFANKSVEKVPGKVIYSSSPDRGLKNALLVMDKVVVGMPEARLHVYYGFDNMRKMGMGGQADELERMMRARDYVVFHGNLPQEKLAAEFQSACVWLYPTNFLETYCITAIEALCSGVYPVVRKWGGLQNTLHRAAVTGMATVIDRDCETDEDVALYATSVWEALSTKAWERVRVNPQDFSWQSVAEQWVRALRLGGKDADAVKRVSVL